MTFFRNSLTPFKAKEHPIAFLCKPLNLMATFDLEARRSLVGKGVIAELPSHLTSMALFAVHTGCRDSEICGLCWKEEIQLDDGSVFLLEGERTKNGRNRIIVLNSVAQAVVDAQRGRHDEYVFSLCTGQNPQCPGELIGLLGWVQDGVAKEVESVAEEGLEGARQRFF
ncbi:tyrosine-type recombinase/integrase [Methylomagnum ishizawai]|uniref:tyrosine-type recombinase/integrase n=1 Tax=Methylomagnum ishizawai TaxID=1760988 RepID=UPI000A161BAF|nr:tyrosine-type recombinase/integrase [Methylomagnum ishizawai]